MIDACETPILRSLGPDGLFNEFTALYGLNPNSFSSTFFEALSFLENAKNSGALTAFRSQNEQQRIFGNELHQIDLGSGRALINDLVALWNNA